MSLSDAGEFGFIARLRSRLSAPSALVGIGDDAAVLPVAEGASLVACADALVAGRHFRLDWSSPADVGWKAVAVNLSDVAAMGAEPRWILVVVAAPPSTAMDVLDGLYDGMAEAAADAGAEIVGGDTVRADELMLSVTVLGEVEGAAMTRSGARPGDVLAVTGPLGRAACGVNLLLGANPRGLVPEDAIACIDAHRRPRPRLEQGRALRAAGAHACLDLSDGLASDVRRLAESSGVGVEIDAGALPVAAEVRRIAERRGWDATALALGGGEDFELLAAFASHALPAGLTPVGRVVADGLWLVRDGVREPLPDAGWDHFMERP